MECFRKFLISINLVKEVDRSIVKQWLEDSSSSLSFLHVSEIEKPNIVFVHMKSEADICKLFEMKYLDAMLQNPKELQLPQFLQPFASDATVVELL